MTDEEKAEKYATENLPDGYTKVNYEKKEAYLAGFADGRKESLEENQKLKVENEDLKAQNQKLNELKKENENLKEQLKNEIEFNSESSLAKENEKLKIEIGYQKSVIQDLLDGGEMARQNAI